MIDSLDDNSLATAILQQVTDYDLAGVLLTQSDRCEDKRQQSFVKAVSVLLQPLQKLVAKAAKSTKIVSNLLKLELDLLTSF